MTVRTSALQVLFLSTIGLAFGVNALTTASFGVLVLPLSKAFGWGRGELSLAMSTLNICNIMLFPLAGWLIDRVGVRKVLLPSVILFGLAFSSLSLISGDIHVFYMLYALLALCGVGTSAVAYVRLIVAWFTAKRGLALGIALTGTGVAVAFLPMLVQWLIASYGWRTAYAFTGLLSIAVMLPPALLWGRYPAERQLGARGEASSKGRAQAVEGLSLREAIVTKSFILLIASFALLGLLTGGIPAHLVPLLVDRGVPAMRAAGIASALGLSFIVGRLLVGYVLDRVFAPLLMLGIVGIALVGLTMILFHVSGVLVVVSIACIGFTIGADTDCLAYMIGRYVGLRAYTGIYGLTLAGFTGGVAVGQAVMGYSVSVSGSYDVGLKVLIAVTVLSTLPMLFLGRYPDAGRKEMRLGAVQDAASAS